MAAVRLEAAADRDAAVRAALQQAAVLNREQLGSAASGVQADLAAKKDVIDTRLDEVRGEVRTELQRLGELVAELGEASAQRFGQVDESLRAHAEITGDARPTTTRALREALANPQARGQWGERMAEDVLRLAGFTEHVNYRKQTAGRRAAPGVPDFTFDLPKGHVLYMDVKFPLAVVPALPRGRHRRRAPGPPQAVPRATCGCGSRSWPSASTPASGDRADRRLRAAVPAQRAAHRVHPRARPGAARRRDAASGS